MQSAGDVVQRAGRRFLKRLDVAHLEDVEAGAVCSAHVPCDYYEVSLDRADQGKIGIDCSPVELVSKGMRNLNVVLGKPARHVLHEIPPKVAQSDLPRLPVDAPQIDASGPQEWFLVGYHVLSK